jgi:hypothetical protein
MSYHGAQNWGGLKRPADCGELRTSRFGIRRVVRA